jgi:hypothetical protein
MKHTRRTIIGLLFLIVALVPSLVWGQARRADYEQATGLRAKLSPLALNIVDRGGWVGKTSRYWYRKSVAGGFEFWVADAASREKTIAFDHARLAAALATASGEKAEALKLPFNAITFAEDEKSVEFLTAGVRYTCDLRSKAFHDVCWKNLGDAGFPDRVLWHKAVAAKYPQYDISRVGIYGNSAGGQNALGGLLFQPDFYKAAVSSCGCHDNRMDKIWWNEQWMGWPLGPEYAASSNVDNAHRLKGQLLLIVGEMDANVDPASTMQVVNALIKADKVFDLLVIPGAGHGMGGAYGERKMFDFFVRHLQGGTPPNWNQ